MVIKLDDRKIFIARERPGVSAVFAVARCLSVRLSVTLVYCIHTAEDIIKLLSPPGSPIILVFVSMRRYPFQVESLQRGRKIHGSGKILGFSTKIAIYLGNGTR